MDDLISRQAVLEATSTTLKITGKENAETVYGYIKKLCNDIKALPSAQKKGHWIQCKTTNNRDVVKCSNCLHTQEICGVKNYCAVCGADMMGEDDG